MEIYGLRKLESPGLSCGDALCNPMFSCFDTICVTDGQTDKWMDGWTLDRWTDI